MVAAHSIMPVCETKVAGHQLIPTFGGKFCLLVFMVAFTYSMCCGTLCLTIKAKLLVLRKQVRRTKSVKLQPSIDSVVQHVRDVCVTDSTCQRCWGELQHLSPDHCDSTGGC